MTIDIRDLRYCEAIARHGSFTKAAKELNIAQPSLSLAIKKLEGELGVVLFARHAKKVIPKPQTRLLLKLAERILEEISLAREEIQAAAELDVSELRIGITPICGLQLFPSIIAKFHAAFPTVVLTATEGSAQEVRAMVENGTHDLGMIEDRLIPDSWHRTEIKHDEIVLCVLKKHIWANRTSVALQDLDDLPMVVLDRSFLERNTLDQLCERAGVQFRLVL